MSSKEKRFSPGDYLRKALQKKLNQIYLMDNRNDIAIKCKQSNVKNPFLRIKSSDCELIRERLFGVKKTISFHKENGDEEKVTKLGKYLNSNRKNDIKNVKTFLDNFVEKNAKDYYAAWGKSLMESAIEEANFSGVSFSNQNNAQNTFNAFNQNIIKPNLYKRGIESKVNDSQGVILEKLKNNFLKSMNNDNSNIILPSNAIKKEDDLDLDIPRNDLENEHLIAVKGISLKDESSFELEKDDDDEDDQNEEEQLLKRKREKDNDIEKKKRKLDWVQTNEFTIIEKAHSVVSSDLPSEEKLVQIQSFNDTLKKELDFYEPITKNIETVKNIISSLGIEEKNISDKIENERRKSLDSDKEKLEKMKKDLGLK